MKLFNIYWWERIFSIPKNVYRETKWFIQRGKRGFSDRDCWDIDYSLSKVIVGMLNNLKENQSTIPLWKRNESEEVAQKRWNNILESMIYTFKCAEKISDGDMLYTTEKNRKKHEELSKDISIPIMTIEECKKYRKGWKNFSEHYNCLWN